MTASRLAPFEPSASTIAPGTTRGCRWRASLRARLRSGVSAVRGLVGVGVSGARQGYPSDLTDERWLLVEPLLRAPRTGVRGGRREKHPRRQIVDAILYVARTGCQ
ncbi:MULTISPECIES: transposase [unclassified Streptomyces]|uniref:transposase n=1 Tax=Streptomyces sp. SID4948 TaxID=2690287 RepID=UPI001F2DDDD8|nr:MULTISPECIES: transposase [unclassified Streptomyces]